MSCWQLSLPRRALAVLAAFILLAVVAVFVLLYLPKAVIAIAPETEIKTASQEITLSTAVENPDFRRFLLPATVLRRELEDSLVVERGADTQFEDFARGRVVLINNQDEEQQLLPQTHLRHEESGVFFLTDSGVAIGPHGEIGVNVTAKEKGSSGNVPAGRFVIDKLPAHLQPSIYGESTQDFSGGLAVEKPISEEEVASAKERLTADLRGRLAGELTAEAGGAALRDDLTSYTDDIVEASVPIGSKAHQFTVRAKVVGRAFLVDENDLLGLTLLTLRGAGSAEEEFVTYNPQSFSVHLVRADFERGEAIVEGSVSGTFASKIGAAAFSGENLAGLSADEVRERLTVLPGVGDVEVSLSPFWVSTVPGRRGSVEIAVESLDNS